MHFFIYNPNDFKSKLYLYLYIIHYLNFEHQILKAQYIYYIEIKTN